MDEEKENSGEQTAPVSNNATAGPEVPDGENTNSSTNQKFPKLQIEFRGATTRKSADQGEIDNSVQLIRQNTIESDRDYRKITQDIIEITRGQLEEHNKDKKPLRRDLLDFIKGLLASQFGMLIFLILINNAYELKISDDVIRVYIVSVFAETLAGLVIMIKYAFDSTQEVKLIAILNEIIRHFKKYEEK